MKIVLIFLSLFLSQTCNKKMSNSEILDQLPSVIETVYFQKWVAGQEESGSGTHFFIQFKTTFPENIKLKKVYFQGQESDLQSEDENIFTANFTNKPKQDRILNADSEKEFGNKPPEITKPKYDLKSNEAILEFEKDQNPLIFKLQNIKQKELLAYPSAKPRN
jgi:hypothetical protein